MTGKKTNDPLAEIAKILSTAKKVSVFMHTRPDGDAYGSAFALAFALDKLQIENVICSDSPVPSNLAFMHGVERIVPMPDPQSDVYIAVDCAEGTRLGGLCDEFFRSANRITVNVDHHISNNCYAKYNYVQSCAANCMNIADLIGELGVPLYGEIADALMTGLLTDSGEFSHDDVDEKSFYLAGMLVRAGARLGELSSSLFRSQPLARARLYAETMSGIRFAEEGKFSFIVISKANMQKYGADIGMTEGFVDFPLSIEGVEVAASLFEMKEGQYKISLRSKTYADVNKIAGTFGGGGHIRAAGCMLYGELEEVVDRLSYAVSQYLL